MTANTKVRRPLILQLLVLLAALAACQGHGHVHEVPPASYPDAAPTPVPANPASPDPVSSDPAVPETWSEPSPGEPAPSQPAPGWDSDYAQPPAVNGAPSDLGSNAERSRADAARPEAKSGGGAAQDGEGSPSASSRYGQADTLPLKRESARGRVLGPRPVPEERPGLATHWGETRYSPAREVEFERRNEHRPDAVAELHYNDRAGARRMLPNADYSRAELRVLGGLRVRIEDAAGRTLPALGNGAHLVGIGAPGERYSLVIENSTASRFEVVASVDGLDVLDGQDGSFEKRGYLVAAYGRVVIDGFRRSEAEVAAFRFGDVARSYAASKGKARNVGVIGIAVFEEKRLPVRQPETWRGPKHRDDTWQRQTAEPFPGRYASPPVW